MGWLFNKKKEVLDLTERYKDHQDKIAMAKKREESQNASPLGAFNMFGAQPAILPVSSYSDSSNNEPDAKRKLARRIMDMTDKIEELSNQLYHLQQRVELLEKKMSSGY